MLHIGIDASRATKTKEKTGTEYYSEQIILALARLDRKNRYTLYSPVRPEGELASLPDNFSWKVMPFRRLWSQVRLGWEFMWGKKPDVVFEPAHTVPLIHPKEMVVTIHDLGFKHSPELYKPFERWYHNFSFNFSVRHARQIITPSKATKDDILNFYPKLDSRQITPIYHGFEKDVFKPVASRQSPVTSPYFYFIGRIEEKKNIRNLLLAFKLFKEKVGDSTKLILSGQPGYGYGPFITLARTFPRAMQDDIRFVGYTNQKEYINYLQSAEVFVFVSNFEGFGMPILEAMACGTPVLTSKVTSMPEVGGDAVIAVDQTKPEAIAEQLMQLHQDAKKRATLSKRGLQRAKTFSWDKAGRETLAVLENVGGRQ